MDHLVVYSPNLLKKAARKRRPKLVWVKKRREAPVGMVHLGDNLYFKKPGGGVFARARVSKEKNRLKGGKYFVDIYVSRITFFSVSFPVLKRDRRSWVVCNSYNNINQQPLLPLPSPTLDQIIQAVSKHYRTLPPKVRLEEATKFFSETKINFRDSIGTMFLVTIISALKNNVDLQKELEILLTNRPSKVFPLSVFKGEK